MKVCLICGAPAEDNVATCPFDGEASWSVSVEQAMSVEPALEEVAKRGPGRPKKVQS